jgi:hypothetical protein
LKPRTLAVELHQMSHPTFSKGAKLRDVGQLPQGDLVDFVMAQVSQNFKG